MKEKKSSTWEKWACYENSRVWSLMGAARGACAKDNEVERMNEWWMWKRENESLGTIDCALSPVGQVDTPGTNCTPTRTSLPCVTTIALLFPFCLYILATRHLFLLYQLSTFEHFTHAPYIHKSNINV